VRFEDALMEIGSISEIIYKKRARMGVRRYIVDNFSYWFMKCVREMALEMQKGDGETIGTKPDNKVTYLRSNEKTSLFKNDLVSGL
jgi:hypothetical protein